MALMGTVGIDHKEIVTEEAAENLSADDVTMVKSLILPEHLVAEANKTPFFFAVGSARDSTEEEDRTLRGAQSGDDRGDV